MQNPDDGNLYPIPPEIKEALTKAGFCTFQIGEEIELKGGRFRVTDFGKRFLTLEGLPGTKIGENK